MPNDYRMGPEGAEWLWVLFWVGMIVTGLMFMGKWIL